MHHASGGFSADALLNTTTALIVALIAAAASIVGAVLQIRSSRAGAVASPETEAWREQAEELTERLEAAHERRRAEDAGTIARLERRLDLRDRTIVRLTQEKRRAESEHHNDG